MTVTVTGTPGAAATYNDQTTYNGQPLGIVLATTSVEAYPVSNNGASVMSGLTVYALVAGAFAVMAAF